VKTRNKRIITAILIACLLLGSAIPALAADYAARVIAVFRAEGEVSLLRGTARAVTPRRGQRLRVDDTLQTGEDSSVHLRMDRETILQMDQNSQVTVESAGRRLILSVEEGRSLVHAEPQAEGNTLETRVGNVGLTVRGTMFTLGLLPDDNINIVMLSGYGDVGDVTLYAGNVMTFDEYGEHTIDELRLEDLDSFTLQAVYDNMEYLMTVGTLTLDMLPLLHRLVGELVIVIRPPGFGATSDNTSPPPPPEYYWSPPPPSDDTAPPTETTPPTDSAPQPDSAPPVETPPEDTQPPDDTLPYPDDPDSDDTGSSSWWWFSPPPRVGGVYQISTVGHLRWVQWWGTHNHTTNRNFILVNDEPLVINFMIPVLNGTFNGNNRTIDVRLCSEYHNSNIARNAPAVGLFGTIGSRGVVHDLNVIAHVNTPAHSNVGGLAGINNGEIRNITLHNDGITGQSNVGDAVGVNNGTKHNVTVTVSAVQTAVFSIALFELEDLDYEYYFDDDFTIDYTYDCANLTDYDDNYYDYDEVTAADATDSHVQEGYDDYDSSSDYGVAKSQDYYADLADDDDVLTDDDDALVDS